jgi:arginine decarboxylase
LEYTTHFNPNPSFVPKYIAFTSGIGQHEDKLLSFENALRDAGVMFLNIVSVSSIYPPHCEEISIAEMVETYKLNPGQITFGVLARNETNENGRLLSSAVGYAKPKEPGEFGYISEVHEFGLGKADTKELAEDRAAELLASLHGFAVDWDKFWDPRSNLYYLEHSKLEKSRPVETNSICAETVGVHNKWTTTVAAAIFAF